MGGAASHGNREPTTLLRGCQPAYRHTFRLLDNVCKTPRIIKHSGRRLAASVLHIFQVTRARASYSFI